MLKFKTTTVLSIDDMLDKFSKKEFESPYRSTIPLLVLFKQDQNLGIDLITQHTDPNTEYIFEFETPERIGTGLPSCTDLMVVSNNAGIGIEAKRTEGKYINVIKWMGESQNKRNVLDGWLSYIYDKTNIQLTVEQILNFPYQMIHRVASACSLQKEKTYVLYIGFDLTIRMKQYYEMNLSALSQLLDNKITMKIICIDIQRSDIQLDLESQWDNGNRDLSVEVKAGIIGDNLMSFA